jgi:excinuclease UvrABC nuclease subunit
MTILQEPGVYILYRDDVPYYIGQATKLIDRLRTHSTPGHRYDLFWNYFSVFVVEDPTARNRIEAILITAFPTANGATPKIKRHPYPKEVVALVRRMRACQIDIASERDSDGTEE